MGMLRDLISRIRLARKVREDIPDDVTTDKHLRSLRRQRRTQEEEVEKEQLMNDIKEFEKKKARRNIFGFREDLEKQERLEKLIETKKTKKKIELLKEKKKIFSEKNNFLTKESYLKKPKKEKSMFL